MMYESVVLPVGPADLRKQDHLLASAPYIESRSHEREGTDAYYYDRWHNCDIREYWHKMQKPVPFKETPVEGPPDWVQTGT